MTILLALLRAYAQDYRHLLTQPRDPVVGVTTSDCPDGW